MRNADNTAVVSAVNGDPRKVNNGADESGPDCPGWQQSAERALAEKYAELFPQGVAVGRKWLASEPEDLVQETFLRLWVRKIPIDADFRAKFFNVLGGKRIDAYRRRLTREKYDPVWQTNRSGHEEPISKDMERQELREILRSAMQQLPEKQRIAVDLYFFNDCSIKEIVQQMSESENNIKSLLHRAKKKLRDYLTENGVFQSAMI